MEEIEDEEGTSEDEIGEEKSTTKIVESGSQTWSY